MPDKLEQDAQHLFVQVCNDYLVQKNSNAETFLHALDALFTMDTEEAQKILFALNAPQCHALLVQCNMNVKKVLCNYHFNTVNSIY